MATCTSHSAKRARKRSWQSTLRSNTGRFRAIWNARKLLRAGVTSAFDAASTYNIAVAVRDAIELANVQGCALRCADVR